MKIKTKKFCALSTNAAWQSWLFNYNSDIYREFIVKLKQSSGCGGNTQVMMDTLQKIQDGGGAPALAAFLRRNHPDMLIEDVQSVFKYTPGLLTYPHRAIIDGDDLESRVRVFLSDKGLSDHIIIDGVAYIEYLEKDERNVSSDNWKIRSYRNKHNIK